MRAAFLILILILICTGCGGSNYPKLKTAPNLKLDAFMGTWHEVARLPLRFEDNCVATSFLFTREASDTIRVESFCWYRHINGPMRKGISKGYVKDFKYPGELQVHFMGPISYPYVVYYIGGDHQFTMLGSPDRKYLWILSRELRPSKTDMAKLIHVAKENGFDTAAFIYPGASPYVAPH